MSDYQARDVTIKAALALDENGKFLALRETLYSNVGGNCVSYVPAANGSRIATTVYKTPYLQMRAIGILTNTLPSVNYRGAGRPQAMLVMERLVDLAAEKTGIDRIELRRRNLIGEERMPYQLARMGHDVVIRDSAELPGGMMRYGIPAYRLPRDVIDGEVQRIVELGVQIECNAKVTDIPAAFAECFHAIFLAVGAHLEIGRAHV